MIVRSKGWNAWTGPILSGQARSSRVLLGLALLVSFASALAAEPAGSQADAATQPELRVETLAHGSFDLATRRGHWVLLNFWATWCAPCLNEMPELDAFDKAVSAGQGAVLAYCRTGTRSTVLRACAKARAGAPAMEILQEAANAGYNISGIAPRLAALARG